MATIRELTVRLGMDVDTGQLKKFESGIASAKASLSALAITVGAAATAIFGIAKLTADHGEEADKLSQRLGVTAESYQQMAFAAHLADIGTDEFNQSMGILVRTMGASRSGSKQATQGFAAVGGNVAKLVKGGASADQVLLAVSDRFKSMKDPAKKAALAQELFGRSGARMIPFLNKGSASLQEAFEKAKQYGMVLDQDTIDASNEFNDGLKELQAQAQGLKNIIGAGLLKTLAPLVTQFNEWISANRELIASQLTDFLSGLSAVVKVAFVVFTKLSNIIITLVQPLGGLGKALQFVVAGFAAFKALQLLASIGTMAQMVFTLGKAFSFAAIKAALMNAQALLIPILIGAAIALAILAIEDLIGFFQGKDSVTGIIVEKFREAWAMVTQLTSEAIDYIMNTKIGDFIRGLQSAFGFVSNLLSPMINIDTAVPGSGVANQRTLNNSINAPMTFQMGGSEASPEKIGSSVYENLDELLRTSSRNMSSAVAY